MPANCVETLSWIGNRNGHLRMIDQTLLPTELREIECHDVETVWEAIKKLRVRGAPAIGIAAVYGVCLGLQHSADSEDFAAFQSRFLSVIDYLASSRPTAVNLFWALDRMKQIAETHFALIDSESTEQSGRAQIEKVLESLFDEARKIHEEDRLVCHAIGKHGQSLLQNNASYLTHCNAGGLATAEYGTALAVFFAASESGKKIHVFADETRPLLQGARLTAWELMQHKIDVTLICDSMAAMLMKQGKISGVVVGADRIAANGDTANKIGTYSVAVAAKAHNLPFYVAAPTSTFDLTLSDGSLIPIEERDPEEITNGFGCRTAPEGVSVYNPAFDVTPAELIAGIITEHGIISPVNRDTIAAIVKRN
ncbi:MAG: S-methyl-5-thioribose-1-phosphate isomerase [Thermoguttaceae bacterium]